GIVESDVVRSLEIELDLGEIGPWMNDEVIFERALTRAEIADIDALIEIVDRDALVVEDVGESLVALEVIAAGRELVVADNRGVGVGADKLHVEHIHGDRSGLRRRRAFLTRRGLDLLCGLSKRQDRLVGQDKEVVAQAARDELRLAIG